jgi:hypothetical protein
MISLLVEVGRTAVLPTLTAILTAFHEGTV